MSNMAEPTRRKELKGWHVLIIMSCFFGVMFAVNTVFVISAVRSHPGEDVPKSYLQGLEYNNTLAARAAQAGLGWNAELGVLGEGPDAALVLRIRDRDGRGVSGLAINAEVRRAASARDDLAVSLEPTGAGEYAALIGDLPTGRWDVRAVASQIGRDELDFEARKTIFIR